MIELIPAIDIIGGQCVRLTKGDYNAKKTYDAHPEDVARRFYDMGVRRLHVVDLDGAKADHIVNLDTLKKITALGMTVDFGGGIKQESDLQAAFDHGAGRFGGDQFSSNAVQHIGYTPLLNWRRL